MFFTNLENRFKKYCMITFFTCVCNSAENVNIYIYKSQKGVFTNLENRFKNYCMITFFTCVCKSAENVKYIYIHIYIYINHKKGTHITIFTDV